MGQDQQLTSPSPLSSNELLAQIASDPHVNRDQQIVHVEEIAPKASCYGHPSPALPPELQTALGDMGIEQLYSHQAEALYRVRAGENIVVVTPTSSGKTLCYNLPIIERILDDPSTRALYIYPINALVNDQLKSLFRMNVSLGTRAVGIARYTGSVNKEKRQDIRARQPQIMLTNPEMIHLSYLLWHKNWATMWRNLRYVVVDEVHTYRGVFGSNMAHLFRRIRRMAHHYGASPQFICCSATIANPGQLAHTLTGLKFSVVDEDGAGTGRKLFVLWNPPLVGEQEENVRRPYAQEAVELLMRCVHADYNTIVFARARRLTERMLRLSQQLGQEQGQDELLDRISSYRAGYLADEREEIENNLKSGKLKGVITTNALEMGIDIGGLDAAIIAGYPGTIMSTWQQAGRAGRRGREALIFMVASQNPLDQYYVAHPKEFFAQPHELAVVDLDNQYVRLKHLLCATNELPFDGDELAQIRPDTEQIMASLQDAGLVVSTKDDLGREIISYQSERRNIHFQVSLRSVTRDTYRIVDGHNNEVGTIEPPNVFREAHPGAIYQHGGDSFRVTAMDRRRRVVRVREEMLPHYTRTSSSLHLKIEEKHRLRTIDLAGEPIEVTLGNVLVLETIRSFQERQYAGDNLVKRVNLDQPLVIRLHTTAMWFAMPDMPLVISMPPVSQPKPKSDTNEASPFEQGLHAIQHLLAGVMPLLVMCDSRDINGFYHLDHPDMTGAGVFIYDAYEGGIGLAEVAYERAEDLLALANETVQNCQCAVGCPSCIQSGLCRLGNDSLNKAAAKDMLRKLVGSYQVGMSVQRQGLLRQIASEGDPSWIKMSRERAIKRLDEQTFRMGLRNPMSDVAEERPIELAYHKGQRVRHTSYGRGVVLSSRLDGRREMVTVRFVRRGLVREFDPAKGMLHLAK